MACSLWWFTTNLCSGVNNVRNGNGWKVKPWRTKHLRTVLTVVLRPRGLWVPQCTVTCHVLVVASLLIIFLYSQRYPTLPNRTVSYLPQHHCTSVGVRDNEPWVTSGIVVEEPLRTHCESKVLKAGLNFSHGVRTTSRGIAAAGEVYPHWPMMKGLIVHSSSITRPRGICNVKKIVR